MRGTIGIVLGLAGALELGGCAGAAQGDSAKSPPPTTEAKASPPAPASSSDQQASPVVEKEAPPKPDMPPSGASLDRVMKAHFKDALLIRSAVIAGLPQNAANPATVLALIENLDDLPRGWRPFVERMQLDAQHVRDATSAAQAAAATADLGVSCGACHQALGGPKASSEPPPAAGATLESRMQLHVWASERLWEGLTVPSGEAWNSGAKALDGGPFPDDLLKQGGVHARNAAAELAKLVKQAPSKKTTEQRAALYAELLVTCGACHRALAENGAKH